MLPLVLCNLTWVHVGKSSSTRPTSLLHSDDLSPGQLTGGLLASSAGRSVCSVRERGEGSITISICVYICTCLCLGELIVCFNYLRGLMSTRTFLCFAVSLVWPEYSYPFCKENERSEVSFSFAEKNVKNQSLVTVPSLQTQCNSTGHSRALSTHVACDVLSLSLKHLCHSPRWQCEDARSVAITFGPEHAHTVVTWSLIMLITSHLGVSMWFKTRLSEPDRLRANHFLEVLHLEVMLQITYVISVGTNRLKHFLKVAYM